MATTPLQARCRRCLADFFLFEIVDRRKTTCPRCGSLLTDSDWVFLEAAQNADAAQRVLVRELARIHAAQGVLAIHPKTLLRNLFEGLNWERPFREDAAFADEALADLDRYRTRWQAHRDDVDATAAGAGTHGRSSRSRRSRRERKAETGPKVDHVAAKQAS